MFDVLIVGAGYLGRAIARLFLAQNKTVAAVTRSAAHASELEAAGISPIVGDLLWPNTLRELPRADAVILCPAPDTHDADSYRYLYVEGIGAFLDVLSRHSEPPGRVLYTSSTGVWGDHAGAWVDESVPPSPDGERAEVLVQAEERLLGSGFPAIVLRLAGIYGPGRNRVQAFRSRLWPEQESDNFMNMIHVQDAAAAALHLLARGQPGSVVVGVDSLPVRESEFCAWLAAKLKMAERQAVIGEFKPEGKRCRNALLQKLGFKFRFPTFCEGYTDLLKRVSRGERV